MSDRVRLHGVLDNEALAAQMRASHVLVVPSTYEGFGIAYLEGMGFGLPAIATSAGAANEIITSGLDGYLVPPEEPDSLASCLAELTSDRQRLIAMSLAARRRYLSHPTWEQSGQHIREFLISLAG
jgi:glycosyltransferase involved in cell wall biosynthesis